jgi:hypothetical protein
MSNECGCAYKTVGEKDMGKLSISYTNSIVKPEERKYLRTLPAHIKVEFQLNNDKLNLLLVYGSPRKINEYLFEDRDEKSLLRIMEQADAINADSSILNKDAVQVEFIRFEYDVEKAAKAVEDSPLPNEYAEMLRGGY